MKRFVCALLVLFLLVPAGLCEGVVDFGVSPEKFCELINSGFEEYFDFDFNAASTEFIQDQHAYSVLDSSKADCGLLWIKNNETNSNVYAASVNFLVEKLVEQGESCTMAMYSFMRTVEQNPELPVEAYEELLDDLGIYKNASSGEDYECMVARGDIMYYLIISTDGNPMIALFAFAQSADY